MRKTSVSQGLLASSCSRLIGLETKFLHLDRRDPMAHPFGLVGRPVSKQEGGGRADEGKSYLLLLCSSPHDIFSLQTRHGSNATTTQNGFIFDLAVRRRTRFTTTMCSGAIFLFLSTACAERRNNVVPTLASKNRASAAKHPALAHQGIWQCRLLAFSGRGALKSNGIHCRTCRIHIQVLQNCIDT